MALQESVPVMNQCPSLCPSWCPSLSPFIVYMCPGVPVFLRPYFTGNTDVTHFPRELNIRKVSGHTGTLGHQDAVDSSGVRAANI
jgi:hypothetical protein